MRVLHVYRTYFPDTQGGLEEVIRQICRNTLDLGIESRVFMLSSNPVPPILKREEAEVHRFQLTFEVASCGVSISALTGFKHLVDWADIVHYHFPWPFADLLHILGRVHKPTLVTYHSDIVRQKSLLRLYRPLMRAFLNQVDVIVPTSQNYFATSEELGRYAEKVEVIPIGLNRQTYPEVSEKALSLTRERVGKGFFLFIGVLRYYKGLHILLEAIQNTSLKCVIVGSGPTSCELREQADRLGLSNVQFLGQVSDIEKIHLIYLSKAMVFPSHLRSEAFGVTLVEGAMFGKPLISTEIGTGTSYINMDGKTGFVVPPSNTKALRGAMLKLEQKNQLVISMGQAAKERYEALFTGSLMGKRYFNLYGRLMLNKSLSGKHKSKSTSD